MADDVSVRFGANITALLDGTKQAANAITNFREMITGVGEAIAAAFAVEQIVEFAKKMGEAAEATEHMSQRLGMSTGDIQKVGGMATLVGGNMDQLGMAMGRLDKAFATARQGGKQQAVAFNELGISIKENYTNMDLLRIVSEKLSTMADGPQKAAVAMALLGRSGAALIPVFNALGQNWDQMSALMQKYGVDNEAAVEAGGKLAEAFNENKVATTGFMEVLTQSLAPAFEAIVRGFNDMIAAMTQSYRSGGLVKQILDLISTTLVTCWTVFQEFGAVVASVWSAVTGDTKTAGDGLTTISNIVKGVGAAFITMGTIIQMVADVVGATINALAATFNAFGKEVSDAIHGNWDQLAKDDAEGWQGIKTSAIKGWTDVVAAAKDGQAKLDQISAGHGSATGPTIKTPGGEGDTSGDATGAPKKAKQPQSRVSEWEAQLQQQLEATNNYFADSKAAELAYWDNILATENVSSKEKLEIAHKEYALKKAIAEQEKQDQIAAIKSKEQLSETATNEEIQLAQAAFEAKKTALDEELAAHKINAVQRAAAETALTRQEVQANLDAEEAIYQDKLRGLQEELSLNTLTKNERDQLNRDIEQLEAVHQSKMVVLAAQGANQIAAADNKAADTVRAKWENVSQQMVAPFTQALTGMLEGTENFRQALIQIFNGLLEAFINGVIEPMIVRWIGKELAQTFASRAGAATRNAFTASETFSTSLMAGTTTATHVAAEAVKTGATAAGVTARVATEATGAAATNTLTIGSAITSIFASAGRAAAGAYAALAGIPIIGPIIAPAAAIAAFAGAAAFVGKIFSAEGGWGEVPMGGAVTQLHSREMVIPRKYADGLRSMIDGQHSSAGGFSGGASSGVGGGANHLHYAPTIHAGTPDLMQLVRRQSRELRKWLTDEAKGGRLSLKGA